MHTRLTRKSLLVITLFVALLFVGFMVARFSKDAAFENEYAAYTALAEEHTESAYLPAANNNPLRQELNLTLGQVLAGEMSDGERLALAEKGLALIEDLEVQIDAIGEKGEAVDAALTLLENEESVLSSGNASELLVLARERLVIIADIRGLSYRANYHAAEILERIVDDSGALTSTHILALNDQLPKVEEQFNKRANLYADLQSTSQKIDTIFSKMAGE